MGSDVVPNGKANKENALALAKSKNIDCILCIISEN
jgi:hypothetical protein